MGILSFASERIQHDLNISEGQMGLLETGMYIGIVTGSVIMPFLFNIISPKLLIIGATILNAASVAVFSITDNYWAIFASRILVGLFISVFIIYFPVWIDQCAPQKSQAMWISMYFLTEDLGIVIGYGVAVLFLKFLDSWKWSFTAQSALMVFPVCFLFSTIPLRYFKTSNEHNQSEITRARSAWQ